MTKVIALSGWKQSGKDTAAAYLMKKYGLIREAFADTLKDMVAEQYNIPRSWCDNPEFKEKALEQYPLEPKDAFSEYMAELMWKECRTLEGYPEKSGVPVSYWTPRGLCILEGSVKRTVNSNYWVDRIIQQIINNKLEQRNWDYVISDLRYRSEVVRLKDAFKEDLVTVRINRFTDITSNDASERDLDNHKFDVVLYNKGSKEDLFKQLDNLVEEINK